MAIMPISLPLAVLEAAMSRLKAHGRHAWLTCDLLQPVHLLFQPVCSRNWFTACWCRYTSLVERKIPLRTRVVVRSKLTYFSYIRRYVCSMCRKTTYCFFVSVFLANVIRPINLFFVKEKNGSTKRKINRLKNYLSLLLPSSYGLL